MSQEPRFTSPTPSSPHLEKNTRSKSRLLRQTRPIYLTDGQISSDHTNISSSEKTILKMEYETKVRKLEKENNELRELVVSLKASQYYELDEQKIRSIIRENESLKGRISQVQTEIKLIQQDLSRALVQNQYLRRNNQALKQDLQKLVKQSVKQKHNYYAVSSKKTIYTSMTQIDDEQDASEIKNQIRERQKGQRSERTQRTSQRISQKISQKIQRVDKGQKTERMNKLIQKKKVIEGQINREKEREKVEKLQRIEKLQKIEKLQRMEKLEKLLNEQAQSKEKYNNHQNSNNNRNMIIVQNQQSIQSIQEKSKKGLTPTINTTTSNNNNNNINNNKIGNKSKSRYRSSSKSGQKLLINSIVSSRALNKRSSGMVTKKQLNELGSTGESGSGVSGMGVNSHQLQHNQQQQQMIKHYKSSGNIEQYNKGMRIQDKEKSREYRQLMATTSSRSPNVYESSGSGNELIKRKNNDLTAIIGDYNQQYYIAKRQQRQQRQQLKQQQQQQQQQGSNKKKKSIYYNI